MNKILLFFITFFLTYSSLFAENTVNISVSKNNITIGEKINLQVNISSETQGNIEIKNIEGIDNFQITGKTQSIQNININGNTQLNHNINFTLLTHNTGSYILGPVSIQFGDKTLVSDTREITVVDLNTVKKENISEKEESHNTDRSKSETENKDILSDIHSVKKLDMNFSRFSLKGIMYLSLFLLLLFAFYIFLGRVFTHKTSVTNKKIIEQNKKQEKTVEINNICSELGILLEKIEKYDQEAFYTQFNSLFRRYFTYIGIDKADKKTLAELQKDTIDTHVLDMFSVSYMYEFSTKKDTLSERKEGVMNFILYLKNK